MNLLIDVFEELHASMTVHSQSIYYFCRLIFSANTENYGEKEILFNDFIFLNQVILSLWDSEKVPIQTKRLLLLLLLMLSRCLLPSRQWLQMMAPGPVWVVWWKSPSGNSLQTLFPAGLTGALGAPWSWARWPPGRWAPGQGKAEGWRRRQLGTAPGSGCWGSQAPAPRPGPGGRRRARVSSWSQHTHSFTLIPDPDNNIYIISSLHFYFQSIISACHLGQSPAGTIWPHGLVTKMRPR